MKPTFNISLDFAKYDFGVSVGCDRPFGVLNFTICLSGNSNAFSQTIAHIKDRNHVTIEEFKELLNKLEIWNKS